MGLRKSILCVLTALALGMACLAPGFAPGPATATSNDNAYRGELPLGKPGLEESRTTKRVVPGVVYTKVERGRESKKVSTPWM